MVFLVTSLLFFVFTGLLELANEGDLARNPFEMLEEESGIRSENFEENKEEPEDFSDIEFDELEKAVQAIKNTEIHDKNIEKAQINEENEKNGKNEKNEIKEENGKNVKNAKIGKTVKNQKNENNEINTEKPIFSKLNVEKSPFLKKNQEKASSSKKNTEKASFLKENQMKSSSALGFFGILNEENSRDSLINKDFQQKVSKRKDEGFKSFENHEFKRIKPIEKAINSMNIRPEISQFEKKIVPNSIENTPFVKDPNYVNKHRDFFK